MVGEIEDEYDVQEIPVERINEHEVRVTARMAIDDLNELLGTDLPEGDWDTVGGLIYGLLGHVPTEGESVDFDGLKLIAERVQGRRIGRVRVVTPGPPSADASEADESDAEHDTARS